MTDVRRGLAVPASRRPVTDRDVSAGQHATDALLEHGTFSHGGADGYHLDLVDTLDTLATQSSKDADELARRRAWLTHAAAMIGCQLVEVQNGQV